MKRFCLSIVWFFSLPFVRLGIAFLLMIVPPVIAAGNGLTTLEPGFTYGVFYGYGFYLLLDSIPAALRSLRKSS